MKILCVVLMAGILGVVSSDMWCMQKWLTECILNAGSETPVCNALKKANECIRSGAIFCDVENSVLVQNYLNTNDEICREGSIMFEMYLKHESCVFQDEANFECMLPAFLKIRKLNRRKSNYNDEVQKILCKYQDRGYECIDNSVLERCGEEALMFKRNYSNPEVAFSREACSLIKENVVYGTALDPRHQRDSNTVT
ncbi:uncharacterized protein NPIL_697501 [Nephila pilipes]|uniref:Uncharacterized protein n=1 Tax=Nephila pilipes TaxID=299642 RepID=A0A8X6MIP7_NEPPI|nr:uncharacterized protein NPIL_697501 [Nephila pilipes]